METLSAESRLTALEQESPLAARLAELACLAVRIDAGLLRRLRQALLPEADPGAESDLWFSAIVESRGTTGFQLAGKVLPLLRQRLQADAARRRRAARITREAHVDAAPAIRLEEALNMLALAGAGSARPRLDDAAAAALEPALRTLAQGGDAALDVARWAVRAAGRLDERVRQTRAAQTLLLAASLRLGMRRTLAEPLRTDLPLHLLANGLPAGGAQRSVGIVRVAGGLQFREPEDGIASFAAPATDPLLVGLAWQGGGIAHERTVEVLPLAVVTLDGDPDEVRLTTLAGDVFRLGSVAKQADAVPAPAQIDDRWLAGFLQLRPLQGPGAIRSGFIVDGDLGLTAADGFPGEDRVADVRSGRQFEVLRARPAALADDRFGGLVVLRPVADDQPAWPPLPLGGALPGEAAAARIAGIGRDGVLSWLDVSVLPRSGPGRQALVSFASEVGNLSAREAFVGAPVVDASGVVAAVIGAEAQDGLSGVALTLLEVPALRQALSDIRGNARQEPEVHRLRVVLVALADEFSAHVMAVSEALRAAGHAVWQVDGSLPLRLALDDIAGSDVFVGLVGWQSGVMLDEEDNPMRRPLVERAYEFARERGLPCVMALSRRGASTVRKKGRDDPTGLAVFRDRLERESLTIVFDDPQELALRVVNALNPLPARSPGVGPVVQVQVVQGDIRRAEPPLLVGHYDGDGIAGVERQLDEWLGGRLSERLALGLYPGALGTTAAVRGTVAEGQTAPEVLVVGLGTIGDLSPSDLTQTLRAALLHHAGEPPREVLEGPVTLAASTLLIGSGDGGVDVGSSAIAVVEAALQANARLIESHGEVGYTRIEIVEAVAERAEQALAALRRWVEARSSGASVTLAPQVERRGAAKPPQRGDWWQRLSIHVTDLGALGFRLTAGGQRAETVIAEGRRLADRLLASTDDRARADPEFQRTLTELLMPADLLSPLLMIDRLALLLDAATAAYPWEVLDRDQQPGKMPPLAARLGLVRQSSGPPRAAAIAAPDFQAGVFAADPGAMFRQPPSPLTEGIALDVTNRLKRIGLKAPTFVNLPATDLMARLLGEPLQLLHLAAPIAWPTPGPSGASAGLRFGADLVLTAAEIRQMKALPQLVFCGVTALDPETRAMSDWPAFGAIFAQDLLQAGVHAVVVPGWPVGPVEARVFTAAFYDALVDGQTFGDCVLYARGQAWKHDPKAQAWAAFQCWGNPGLTLLPARHLRSQR